MGQSAASATKANQGSNVDLFRVILAGLAVACFALSLFNDAVWLKPVLALMIAASQNLNISRIDALLGVLVSASVLSLMFSVTLVEAVLRKRHVLILVALYLGYGLTCSLAMMGAYVSSEAGAFARTAMLLAVTPAGLSLLAAAAAATFFSGIHELEDDIERDSSFDEGIPLVEADSTFSHRN